MKFKRSHYMFGHKTTYYLSDNLLNLYENCETCKFSIIVEEFEHPENIDQLICKTRTDYYVECCSCLTVTECRAKHDCCCSAVLDKELEEKRIESKEREARAMIKKDPELADLIAKNQVKDLQKIFVENPDEKPC